MLNDCIAQGMTKLFWGGLGAWTSYNLFDAGLSRFLVLETLLHGTGPRGYLGISQNGADPNFGGAKHGSSIESCAFHVENSKNYFHVFADSAYESPNCSTAPNKIVEIACKMNLGNHVAPKMHAILSSQATFKDAFPSLGNTTNDAIGFAIGLLTPTLKFRFLPDDVLYCEYPIPDPSRESKYRFTCRFFQDIDYHFKKMAYRTPFPIDTQHLGITGSLVQGTKGNVLARMQSNPEKVALGSALLAAASTAASLTLSYLCRGQKKPIAAIAHGPLGSLRNRMVTVVTATAWAAFAASLILFNTL